MQNRFKFRVWDKKRKCYIKNPEPTPLLQANGLLAYFTNNPDAMNNYDIQFCTGLKDKNGKLVYEGDIVTYDDRDIYPYHTPILNAVIEMRKYQWCMVYYRKDIINADTRKPAEQKTWLGFDDFITSRIEVIGNIYENKELLESEG